MLTFSPGSAAVGLVSFFQGSNKEMLPQQLMILTFSPGSASSGVGVLFSRLKQRDAATAVRDADFFT
jgi:hypothetical protein